MRNTSASHHGDTETPRTYDGGSRGLLSWIERRSQCTPLAVNAARLLPTNQPVAAGSGVGDVDVRRTPTLSPALPTPEVTERCSWYDLISVPPCLRGEKRRRPRPNGTALVGAFIETRVRLDETRGREVLLDPPPRSLPEVVPRAGVVDERGDDARDRA